MNSEEWNGEDLPPVGTVCEYLWDEGEWRKCEVVAHYSAYVVAVDAFYSNSVLLQLHRIELLYRTMTLTDTGRSLEEVLENVKKTLEFIP